MYTVVIADEKKLLIDYHGKSIDVCFYMDGIFNKENEYFHSQRNKYRLSTFSFIYSVIIDDFTRINFYIQFLKPNHNANQCDSMLFLFLFV